MKSDIDRLQQRLDSLKNQEQVLQSNLTTLDARRAQIAQELPRLEKQENHMKGEVEAARAELQRIDADRRVAENLREAAFSMAQALEQRIKLHEKSVKVLQEMIEGLAEKAKACQPEQPPVQTKLEDFQRPMLLLKNVGENARAVLDERESFGRFEQHVRDSGFVFHERVFKAFHTSLKIGDISPLVVLAGISGTGKSQLPRLYAEAMGMHFLNVAVQPRWDAPQDLFGFYNYMENRYKATELGRALRQMDYRNWKEEDQSLQKVQEGMLLVLLDEMNLARIEYYFSELLSKLEMRNAALAGNQDALAHALIYLELGSLKPGEESRHMFVGENVLFVGTINEDETTQSLSDKVIDRANVLRLGRPDTTVRPDPRGGAFTRSGHLPYQRWHGQWRTPAAWETERQRLSDTCRKLNEALEPVGRPFGYRAHRAIERYVESYPRWDRDSWFNHAVADQLEQKIIPKLRGLSKDDEEVQKAYDNLKPIIGQTGDDQLVRAFEAATDRPVFQWTGVSRLNRIGTR